MDDIVLKEQEIDGIKITVGSINTMIDKFAEALDTVVI